MNAILRPSGDQSVPPTRSSPPNTRGGVSLRGRLPSAFISGVPALKSFAKEATLGSPARPVVRVGSRRLLLAVRSDGNHLDCVRDASVLLNQAA